MTDGFIGNSKHERLFREALLKGLIQKLNQTEINRFICNFAEKEFKDLVNKYQEYLKSINKDDLPLMPQESGMSLNKSFEKVQTAYGSNNAVEFNKPPNMGTGKSGLSKQIPESMFPKIRMFQLPNATVGKEFEIDLIKTLNKPELRKGNMNVTLDKDLGLLYDPFTLTIKGVPAKSGDFVVTIVHNVLMSFASTAGSAEYNLKLTINPDPKALWKDIASDQAGIYTKPDKDTNFIQRDRKIVAASLRGRSHAHEGKYREDHFKIDHIENDWYIIAVADGAGSAKYSRQGSRIACDTAVNYLKEKLKKSGNDIDRAIYECSLAQSDDQNRKKTESQFHNLLIKSAYEALIKIDLEAKTKSIERKEFATTLMLAIAKRSNNGLWFIGTYWVGDGGVAIYDEKNSIVKLMGEPDGGEFSGQTCFLTMNQVWDSSANSKKRAYFEIVQDFSAIVLMTDGITDPKFEAEKNLSDIEKWNTFWKEVKPCLDADRPTDSLLDWLDFWSQGNHDDRTIAVLF